MDFIPFPKFYIYYTRNMGFVKGEISQAAAARGVVFALQRLPFQGSWLGAAETERLLQICIEKPKPQI